MSLEAVGVLLRRVRRFAHDLGDVPDAVLLDRFARGCDAEAFETLLARHGPMVYGVCRRALHCEHDAEDAFQATFLVLARQAGTVQRPGSLASWLHGVAHRTAGKARGGAQRRAGREQAAEPRQAEQVVDNITWREVQAALDAELLNLAERYRAPLVLCYLQAKTQEEAARELGWSRNTLRRRLEAGRDRLRRRLEQRGITLAAALTASALAPGPAAAGVIRATATAAAGFAAGHTSAGVGLPVVTLAHEVLRSLKMATLCRACAWIICVGLLSAGLVGYQVAAGNAEPVEQAPAALLNEKDTPKPRIDVHGDPLPEGALMRLGTLRRRAVDAKMAITPDGKTLISVRGGRYVTLWDVETGRRRETRELPGEAWYWWWLSGDGRWLARTNMHNALELWDVGAGKQVESFKMPPQRHIAKVAFSPDGKRLAMTGSGDGSGAEGGSVPGGGGSGKVAFQVWDIAASKRLFATSVTTQASPQQVEFSPDGKRLFGSVSSVEHGMHCWDIAGGRLVWQNKEFAPEHMMVTTDGKIVSSMERFHVVDAATGQAVPLKHQPPIEWGSQPLLCPDGRTLLVGNAQGVVVWDLETGKDLRMLAGAGERFVLAPDGKTIVTNDGALQRWDIATGKALYPDRSEDGHRGEVLATVASRDGKRLASASRDGTVRLWDLNTGQPVHTLPGHEAQRPLPLHRWSSAGVTALAMTPDGRWILSAGSEARLRLWDAAAGKEIRALELPLADRGVAERLIHHVHISPDGSKGFALFAPSGGFSFGGEPGPDFTPQLGTWDLATGKLVKTIRMPQINRHACSFSADGRTLLLSGLLVDVSTGEKLAALESGPASGFGGEPMALSHDGAIIAGMVSKKSKYNGIDTIGPDGVRVWETATGKTVAHVKTTSWVGQLAFHPNNRYLVTNDLDHVQIWDLATRQVVARRTLPEQVRSSATAGTFAGCLTLTPDGRLITGLPDSTILVWQPPLALPRRTALAEQELDAMRADVTGADPVKAWGAIWRLGEVEAAPLLPFFRQRLKRVEPAPVEQTRRLLDDLDSANFERRQKASGELRKLGILAAPALRQALATKLSLELQRRVQASLKEIETPLPPSPADVADLRLVAALEQLGGAAAREVLADLARGVPDAPLTRYAQAALTR